MKAYPLIEERKYHLSIETELFYMTIITPAVTIVSMVLGHGWKRRRSR